MRMPAVVLLTFWISTAYGADDYAAWAKEDSAGLWTRTAEEAVRRSELPESLPEDIKGFCPTYPERDREERVRFWVGLLSAMARAESDCRTEVRHLEAMSDRHGRKVISRGLLQISIESANQPRYDCLIAKDEDLHDPLVNLNCAVKILNHWIRMDRRIASPVGGAPRGGGRYWATLRENHPRFLEITATTRKLSVCHALPRQEEETRTTIP